jgi:DNA-directed RNA polymerase specialized sigma24 family protein
LLTNIAPRLPANEFHTTVPLKELQTRVACGDVSAFTQVYLHFGKKLILFGVSLVRSKEIAEELVEDVFVKLWANRQGIPGIEISPFIYT